MHPASRRLSGGRFAGRDTRGLLTRAGDPGLDLADDPRPLRRVCLLARRTGSFGVCAARRAASVLAAHGRRGPGSHARELRLRQRGAGQRQARPLRRARARARRADALRGPARAPPDGHRQPVRRDAGHAHVRRKQFALADLRDKRFYVGPAAACNIARLTSVPVPGHVLVDLLRGEAPVLKHDAPADDDGLGFARLLGAHDPVDARRARGDPSGPAPGGLVAPVGPPAHARPRRSRRAAGLRALPRQARRPCRRPDRRTARGSRQPRAAAPAERSGLRRRDPTQDPPRGALPEGRRATVSTTASSGTRRCRRASFVQQAPPGMRTEPVDCE